MRTFPIEASLDELLNAGHAMSTCQPGVRVRYRDVLFDLGALRDSTSDRLSVRVKPCGMQAYVVCILKLDALFAERESAKWRAAREAMAYAVDNLLAECRRVSDQMSGALVVRDDVT